MQFSSSTLLISLAISLLSLGNHIQAQTSPVAIAVQPPSASLKAGESATFYALVSGAKVPAATWSLVPPIGTLTYGVYTAPATITSPQTVTVIATSVADPTKVASATVSLVTSPAIAIIPASARLQAGQSLQFTASIAGAQGLSNPSVSWSLTPPVGSIKDGLYTAPAAIQTAQTVVLTATSVTDSTTTAQVSITLSPSITLAPSPRIAVSPAQVTLQASQTQLFTATAGGPAAVGVQWSISPNFGSVTPSGQYTAPNTIVQEATVTLTATTASNPPVTASATITLVSPASVPLSYNAISDTVPRVEGPAPPLGPANSVFIDPDFGTRILRVSDPSSIPGKPNIDVIGAASWQSSFNADSTKFLVGAADGSTYFYQFDHQIFKATMIMDPANPSGPLQLNFGWVNGFSYQNPNILYGMSGGLANHSIGQYDFSTNTYTMVANIDAFLPAQDRNWSGYAATVYNDYYDANFAVAANGYIVVYNKPSNRAALINLVNSTFQAFNSNAFVAMSGTLPPASSLHGFQIDKSGRYVAINYSDAIDSNIYVDLQTGSWSNDPYCHRVMGFGDVAVNCGNQASNDSDGFYVANLSNPTQHTFLAQNPNGPKRWNSDAHPSWNNARPNVAAPFVADLRIASPSIFPMRSWDDELIAVATDGSNMVWRFAHMHAVQTGFYYTVPFAHVSPDGQYALINSNWEGTLGTASDTQTTYNGAPTDQKRVDVFLVELNQRYPVPTVDSEPPATPVFIPGIDGSTVLGTINLTATSSDNVGVVAMRYAVDGNWQPEITTAPFTFFLDTATLSNGYHVAQAYARDAQNNVSVSNLIGFMVSR